MVVRMKQLVCFFAVRLTQILLVDFDNRGIKVGFADGQPFISAVDGVLTRLQDGGIAMVVGLSTTVDATTGAGHDFNGVILGFAALDALEQLADIAQTRGNSRLQLDAGNRNRSFLDAFETRTATKSIGLSLSPSSQPATVRSGLKNAAGGAEDNGGTSGFAQRVVVLLIGRRSNTIRHL